jgi:hypothetical protein
MHRPTAVKSGPAIWGWWVVAVVASLLVTALSRRVRAVGSCFLHLCLLVLLLAMAQVHETYCTPSGAATCAVMAGTGCLQASMAQLCHVGAPGLVVGSGVAPHVVASCLVPLWFWDCTHSSIQTACLCLRRPAH